MVSSDFTVLPALMVSERIPECGSLACRGPGRDRGRREQVTQQMLKGAASTGQTETGRKCVRPRGLCSSLHFLKDVFLYVMP